MKLSNYSISVSSSAKSKERYQSIQKILHILNVIYAGNSLSEKATTTLMNVLHVVEGEALEGPLVEALLLALVQAVHRLQPSHKLLSNPCSRANLRAEKDI